MKKVVLLSILVVVIRLAVGVIAEAQQPSRTQPVLDPVYDPAYKGTTHSALGGPFLIQVNGSFFRQTASYPRGETVAQGTFLFVDVTIFNKSDRTLQIPRFTLQDSRGTTYLTAIRARRSSKAILGGESLNPGVSKSGYLIFDVPLLSGFESLPLRYRLLIAYSRHSIDINVRKTQQ
jgi:hypothetical protein